MILKELRINSFRNFKKIDFAAGEDFNVFIGKNAQGKSNFLEALYCLGLGKSYRTNSEEEIIGFTSDYAFITGIFLGREGSFTLEIGWEKSDGRVKKAVRYNGNPVSRLIDFIDKAPMVLFTADDLDLVRGKPEDRRRFLDLICSRISPPYSAALREYKKILELRNAWLKLPNKHKDRHLGEVYTDKLCLRGAEIILKRLEILESLGPLLSELYMGIFETEAPEIRYRLTIKNSKKRSPEAVEEAFRKTLEDSAELEAACKFTVTGPHRDDFSFRDSGRAMKSFSSMGEIRSAAVILKMAEAALISEQTKVEPVILIDDCLSEFDPERIKLFLGYLSGRRQVFYTVTDYFDYLKSIERISFYNVSEGKVEKCSRQR